MLNVKKLLTNMMDTYRAGAVTYSSIPVNGYADKTVLFGRAMKSTPAVTAIRTASGTVGYNLQITVTSVSTTGFTLRVWNYGTAAVGPTVSWTAVASTE